MAGTFRAPHCLYRLREGGPEYETLNLEELCPVRMYRRRNRLVALIAAFLLIAALGAYAAHGPGDRTHDNAHCDLCAHFSGSAGAPAPPAVVGKPVLAARVLLIRPEPLRAERRRVVTHLPRGPPPLAV